VWLVEGKVKNNVIPSRARDLACTDWKLQAGDGNRTVDPSLCSG